jgi:uncharacterized protein (TIGR00369 family)
MSDRTSMVSRLAAINREFTQYVVLNQEMGITIGDLGDGRATAHLPWAAELVGDPCTGVLHPGVLSVLLDATCGLACFQGLDAPMPIATLDLRIDMLRPATPRQDLVAEAWCTRVGRSVVFVQGRALAGGVEIATCAASFMRDTPVSRDPRPAGPRPAGVDPVVPAPDQPAQPVSAAALRALIVDARSGGSIAALVGAVPFLPWLGVSVRRDEGGLSSLLSFRPRIIGNPAVPAIHGGAIGALLEVAGAFEVMLGHDTQVIPKTVDVSVDYLRPGRPMDTFARARVLRSGRRVVNVAVEAWQDSPNKPVATGRLNLLVPPMGGAGG